LANQAMLSRASGRLGDAKQLIERALTVGEHAQPHGAIPIYWFQRLTLADFVGGLEEIQPALHELVARYPARAMFRCALTYVDARLGRVEKAAQALHALSAHDVSALPVDQEWLYGMSLLAEAAAIVRDAAVAAVLYRLLVPWAHLNAADVSEGVRGSISRYLGLLATTQGRHKQAATHFDQAIAMNARMRAIPWLAHTQRDYARLLLARDQPGDQEQAFELNAQAITTYKQLRMDTWLAEATKLPRTIPSAPASAQ
jgi:tetratricopeptide (TPR) repeat protein